MLSTCFTCFDYLPKFLGVLRVFCGKLFVSFLFGIVSSKSMGERKRIA
ncbi:hypothetical protein Pla144_15050 [Bythopirellula polymerisocia]|uniref:Uncharacterized protein n=1 Tax=Bythopirellula polymerisocia TaxID=2528003 RepID=A0A5C6CUW0_9BACT|nr:hypothetical protein Pla144_15050 [Bythopirellula polymerisocia]